MNNLFYSVLNLHPLCLGDITTHSETTTREEVLHSIQVVESKYCAQNNSYYKLNGDIEIKMIGKTYSILGQFKNVIS